MFKTIYNKKETIYGIIFILIPFLISYVVWFVYLDPTTYWQKLFSIICGFITVIIVFLIEIKLIE